MRAAAGFAALVGAMLAGCMVANAPERVSAPAERPRPPFCEYALSAPVQAAGELAGYFGEGGVDCVPPDGDPGVFRFAFGIGTGRDAHRLVVRVPRPVVLGDAVEPAALVDGSNDCAGWARVIADVPDWELEVDLECGGARLEGWFAGAWPLEWRG